MGQEFNIGRLKVEAIAKAFGVDIEKAAHGVYEDNAENRRLNRVGQEYGKTAEEKQSAGKQPKKGAEEVKVKETVKTEQEKKTSTATMESAAQGASDEALKRASQDPKAPEDVKAAAKKELANRGSGETGDEEVEEKVQFDEKAYNKGKKRLVEIDKQIKKYEPYVDREGYEFVKKEISKLQKEKESIHQEIGVEGVKRLNAETAKKSKRDYIKTIKEDGGSKYLDDFLQKNSEHFKEVLDEYGAKDFNELQEKVEEKFADDPDDPYGYEHMDKLYFKCLHAVPDEKFLKADPYKFYNSEEK